MREPSGVRGMRGFLHNSRCFRLFFSRALGCASTRSAGAPSSRVGAVAAGRSVRRLRGSPRRDRDRRRARHRPDRRRRVKELRIRIFDPKSKLQLVEQTVPMTAPDDVGQTPEQTRGERQRRDPHALSLDLLADPCTRRDDVRVVVTARGPIEENGPLVDIVEKSAVTSFKPHRRLLLSSVPGTQLLRPPLSRSARHEGPDLRAREGHLSGRRADGAQADARPAAAARAVVMHESMAATPVECQSDVDCGPALTGCGAVGLRLGALQRTASVCIRRSTPTRWPRARGCQLSDVACGRPVLTGDDCDDTNSARYGGAWDGPGVGALANHCDMIDDDCNGSRRRCGAERQGLHVQRGDGHQRRSVRCSRDRRRRRSSGPLAIPPALPSGKRSCKDGEWLSCEGALRAGRRGQLRRRRRRLQLQRPAQRRLRVHQRQHARPCGVTIGSCKPGTQRCVDAKWSSECVGAVGPARADTCDARQRRQL